MNPILTHEYVLVNPATKPKTSVPLAEYILSEIKQYGDAMAMVHSLTNESVSYNSIIKESIKVAEGLKFKGVQVGDVVAICSENRFEYASVVLGILAVGGTCFPINPLYNIDELVHTMSIAKPKIIFCSPFVEAKFEECCSTMKFIEEVIMFNRVQSSKKMFSLYDDFIKNSATLDTYRFPMLNPEECVAFLFCSSGTTGLPKCVELTHANFTTLLDFCRILWNQDPSDTVLLGLIPFFHGYGCCILLAGLLFRSLNVVMMRFDEENFLSSIEKYKITNLYLVPPLVVFLSKHPLVSKYNLSSIRKVVCGAAPLSKETQLTALKRLKINDLQQGYGMTELTIVCVAFQTDVRKTGSSGTIAPGMECKIVDLETGKALPPYERGELCFRGPFVMKGYRNNPEATRDSFDSNGWFHTGDIGYYDSDGYLFIVERLKELIKYKGFQVPPAELETLLINHPSIKEAGVIGIPDEEAGELPMAFVVLQPGAKMTEKDIQNYIAGKVSPQKRLHGGVKFINEIPKNPSGKILRRELRKLINKSKL